MENTSFKSLGISEDILEALLKLGYKNPSNEINTDNEINNVDEKKEDE